MTYYYLSEALEVSFNWTDLLFCQYTLEGKSVDELKSMIRTIFERTLILDSLHENQQVTNAKLEALTLDVRHLQGDVQELKTDVTQLKDDVQELKTDVSQLKVDFRGMKVQLNGIEENMEFLKHKTLNNEKDIYTLKTR
jgi:chromosome segregation ATPase